MYKVKRQVPNLKASDVSSWSLSFYQLVAGEDKATGTSHYVVSQSYVNLVHRLVADVLRPRRDVFGDPSVGYKTLLSGTPPEVKRTFDAELPRVKNSNPGWKKAKETGEIIMGPHQAGRVIIHHNPGERVVTRSSGMSDSLEVTKLPIGTRHGNRVYISDRIWVDGYVQWKVETVQAEPVWPTDFGWDLTAERLLQDMTSAPLNFDPGIVTSAIAEANTGSMDLLTAAAEMPETIRSIFDGIKVIGDLTKAAKNKELTVNKRLRSNLKRIKSKYEEKLRKINRQRLGASNYERTLKKREAEEIQKLYSRERNQQIREAGDAITSVWMNYRYNIMPNVYTIDDALDLLANWHTDFVTTRQRIDLNNQFPVPDGFDGPDTFESIDRVTLKRKYVLSGDLSTKLLQLGSANIAVTALELVRRSFVLGWFINLGDVLSAYTAVPVHEQEVCCYARKISSNQTFTGPHGCSVHVNIDTYKREVINPSDHIGLKFDPNITLFRAFDSIALLWPTLKSNILRTKRNSK